MQQAIHVPQSIQLPLFEAFLAEPVLPGLKASAQARQKNSDPERFSELALRGAPGHCQSLLAPVLRDLSEEVDARWLTLIAPPASLTQAWLRDAGLNRERILLLHPSSNKSALQLTCEALRMGHSHTVVSWLGSLNVTLRQQLIRAATVGNAQSLNIRLG
ncbi:SOS-induced cell division inhibitor SulA [Pseudomonas plecoglossicida]|uniref:SOS-induced cell division inhibitor SulA n=1 Tax=Pseudomonas plecoglossicida TaxID=70775 RepID=UPI0015E48015|nr:SOS-induced cell division inhibitor SulA [Pseudomonas plecoglossicida]MBA1322904.1 CDP-glycerol--UDP-pyrophosphoryl-N-acetylglucosaminyl-N-acetylmannosamine glycerophosphotransferase [Pseudomonas plecoglossicida]